MIHHYAKIFGQIRNPMWEQIVNEFRISIRLPVDSHLDNSSAFNDRSVVVDSTAV